jgi:hypothetical protein
MKNNIQKKIQVGLMGIVLVLMYSGCAKLSEEFAKMKSPEAQEVSSEEAKSMSSLYREALNEKKSQPVEQTATTSEKKGQPAQSSRPCVHKVRWSGETLSVIAKWYTGDFENWEAITKANPKINPNRMFIGSKILIPGDLVKNREPMPQEFLGKVASKGKNK